MKKTVEILTKLLKRTTLCFTLLTFFFAVAGYAVKPDANAIMCSELLYMLLFSLMIGISFCICDFVKKNSVVRRALQFVLSYVSFALMFFVGGAGKTFIDNLSQNKAFTIICVSLVFIGVYVVIAALHIGFGALSNMLKNSKQKYVPQFNQNDNK